MPETLQNRLESVCIDTESVSAKFRTSRTSKTVVRGCLQMSWRVSEIFGDKLGLVETDDF